MTGRVPKLIAFYLPQYHPIPENDGWWGEGFTDWVNVAKAQPLFPGHLQPRVPHPDLGYYNPLNPGTLETQARIARDHGLHGFCFYHYWFNGRLLLERPLQLLLSRPDIDLPFCVCWANEPWTRAWDGKERDVLMPQSYGGEEEWAHHFDYLLPALRDPRAIAVSGAPVILIYRIASIPNVNAMLRIWRSMAVDAGLPGLHVVSMLTGFTKSGELNNVEVDAACEFLPNYILRPQLSDFLGPGLKIGLHMRILKKYTRRLDHIVTKVDYDAAWRRALRTKKVLPTQYRGAFVSWDNSPRKGARGMILANADPERYQYWLGHQLSRVVADSSQRPFVFINAWNEWAEGAYLEPDAHNGYAYLFKTKHALDIVTDVLHRI
jgi:lipopolysaccharide biosynthesis protein